jgi:hypothetical protein
LHPLQHAGLPRRTTESRHVGHVCPDFSRDTANRTLPRGNVRIGDDHPKRIGLGIETRTC